MTAVATGGAPVATSIVNPRLRTAAFLAALATEVTRRVFASSRVLQLDRDPGERPPDPDQVCPACQRTQDVR